ncbi:hypothetical protein P29A0810_078 [Synechococcus phage S-CAM8]|jgi:hypothetical protein|uniref:Uncharacterized protein n=1 Tax=Synechococcus phage S-CAM8 TaxID=754038 RepID=G8EXQ6_9CAUD|nr:hypothetical protein SXCG_00007 [Synechococcus phage S-CAM8]AET72596.1 hypothetical protein SXFG_00046 [Synechococcus phage S-CAM8]AGN33917.1 hypothetical protein SXCG_00007 [Synechococcus phage S-CAM8]AOV60014.1 hypothetical protein P29A0810_078 [Synechococcus phage S-CAM8]
MTPEEVQSLNDALVALNGCIKVLGERLEALEKYVVELPTPDKVLYKPKDVEEYLDMKGNYDEIYRRIGELKDGM